MCKSDDQFTYSVKCSEIHPVWILMHNYVPGYLTLILVLLLAILETLEKLLVSGYCVRSKKIKITDITDNKNS